ncbi:MAG: dienelactone hydrolase family protein [Humibacillus sp.]|nr:dienelactone hydrolase family protein [Humibacillus sp.]
MSEPVTVPTDSGDMPAHLWLPPSGTGPGVVVLQEIFGVSDYVQRRAGQLAEQGYVVIAPEIYWRLGVTEPVQGQEALTEGMALVRRLDWDRAVSDATAAVSWLRGHDDVDGGVGVLGFCFGGGLAYAVAAGLETASGDAAGEDPSPVDALVSYYGSALPELYQALTVTAPSLHHFGLADSFIDTDTVRAIEARLTQQPATVFETYAGADHAFDNDDMGWHDAGASALAWSTTREFLREHLPTA